MTYEQFLAYRHGLLIALQASIKIHREATYVLSERAAFDVELIKIGIELHYIESLPC